MRFRCQTSQPQQQLQALPLQTTRGRHRPWAGENRGEGKLPAHAARASPQARPVPQQPIRNLADGAALTAGTAVEDDRITLLRSIWFPKMESAAYVTGSPHKGLQRGRKGSRHFYLKIPPGAEPQPGPSTAEKAATNPDRPFTHFSLHQSSLYLPSVSAAQFAACWSRGPRRGGGAPGGPRGEQTRSPAPAPVPAGLRRFCRLGICWRPAGLLQRSLRFFGRRCPGHGARL